MIISPCFVSQIIIIMANVNFLTRLFGKYLSQGIASRQSNFSTFLTYKTTKVLYHILFTRRTQFFVAIIYNPDITQTLLCLQCN